MWGRKRGRLRRGRRRARGWVQEGRRRARTRGLALGAGPHLPGALGRSRTCCPRWSASSGAAMGDVCDTGGLVFFFFWFVCFLRGSRRHTHHHLQNHLGRSREGRSPRFLSLGFPRAWWLGFLAFCFLTRLHYSIVHCRPLFQLSISEPLITMLP